MLRQPELVDYLVILIILGIAVISSVIHRYLTFGKPTKGGGGAESSPDHPAAPSEMEDASSFETSGRPQPRG